MAASGMYTAAASDALPSLEFEPSPVAGVP
jgi:hypothetical protein